MKYIIIGTAGHVDHGKSAIIKALTGIETDRLKEEKLRGISIDLGFAALKLNDSMIAGIVDVPGHERFLKNMLAGTGGIDLAMLVIAADEGIMPQTREHLAMLQLYGIKNGVVVLNKIDKVDEEWLELVESDIREYISGTFLKEAPLCRVSAHTGAGLGELKKLLEQQAGKIPSRDSTAPFRMWIDRVFTIKGHGVVVTGSVLTGSAKVGDSLELKPAGTIVRIRGLQWHGERVEQISAGQRAAINLAGVENEKIGRGMALSAIGRGETGTLWDIRADWQEEVASGLRVRLHIGTGEFLGRIYSFKETDPRYMRLLLEQPLSAGAGDRGIIRLYSPQILLGGITIIAPGRNTRRLTFERAAAADAIGCQDFTVALYYRLAESRLLLTREDIQRMAGYLPNKKINQAIDRLVAEKKVLCLERAYIAAEVLNRITDEVRTILKEYHKKQPDRSGLSKEIIRQKLDLNEKSFEAYLALWQLSGFLIVADGLLSLKQHAEQHGGWQQELIEKAEAALENIGLQTVDQVVLKEKLSLPTEKIKVAHDMLVRSGVLVKLGDMYVYRKTIQYIVQLIHKHFCSNDTLTVAELRDILNTSRKFALPVMEYLDMHKYTVRVGDIRRPTRRILDLSE